MKLIPQSIEVMTPIDGMAMAKFVERVARTCYKSENKITPESAVPFVRKLIRRGHEAMLEHVSMSVRFTTNRAIANEIVRHRLASFAQESTRYCDYVSGDGVGDIAVVSPKDMELMATEDFIYECKQLEELYRHMRLLRISPQIARDVLPLALKTELIMTANMREWRHFLKLRTSSAAHPQIRELAFMVLKELKEKAPVFVEDIRNYEELESKQL